MTLKELRGEWRWLASGVLLMFCSGFGQTYDIALFAGRLKTELALTDGEFGGLYTLGTLMSAAALTVAGRLADSLSVRWLGAGVLCGLAATAIGMSYVTSGIGLALAFVGLRFFGQGMCTHVAMTAMGRWFNRKRGQAVAIASLGMPGAEGLLPLAAVGALGLVGWRAAWQLTAAALLLAALPLLVSMLHYERHPTLGPAAVDVQDGDGRDRRHWSRAEVLRDPLFWLLLPVMLATPFVVTALFINQVPLVEFKGWQLAWIAAAFPVLAAAHVVAALTAGRLVDRYGARRLLKFCLLPLGLGLLILVHMPSVAMLPVAMALVGVNLGLTSTTQGALWAELYGVLHLGAIRAVAIALVVFATAASPGLVGLLLDRGVALALQLDAMAIYCFAAAAWTVWLGGRLDRTAAG